MEYGIIGFDHVGIYVDDLEASKKFYTEILGFELVSEWIRSEWDGAYLGFYRLGSCMIELVKKPYGKTACDGPLNHLTFSVKDIARTRDELQKKGVAFETQQICCDEGLFDNGVNHIFFRGPSSERLQLVESR